MISPKEVNSVSPSAVTGGSSARKSAASSSESYISTAKLMRLSSVEGNISFNLILRSSFVNLAEVDGLPVDGC